MKQWPKDNTEAVSFDELIEPLAEIMDTGKADATKVYSLGRDELACSFNTDYALSKEGLEYHAERGRNLNHVIVMLAVQLGIEQGRRIEANKRKIWIEIVRRELQRNKPEDIRNAVEGLLRLL